MLRIIVTAWLLIASHWVHAKEVEVVVADAFIELHTGPGRGYPVFHVVARGNTITIIKRHTDWFNVRDTRGKAGWVPQRQLEKTLTAKGDGVKVGASTRKDYLNRRWEFSVGTGDFGGAALLSANIGYWFTTNMMAEIMLAQALGEYSDNLIASSYLVMQPYPKWKVSPYASIGTGIVRTSPHAALAESEDRTDQMISAGTGLRYYWSQRYFIRADYNGYLVLTSRDENTSVNEWKLGLSVFF
jgi:uncharacterized protein YgiM (DUF1202 family)